MIPNVTIMTRAVMPSMTNFRGILFGGMLMEWMDEVAGITAKRFAGSEVATVAVEQMKFLKPVPVGAFVEVSGEVVEVGNTSLRIRIRAVMDGEAPDAGWDEHCIPVAEAITYLNSEASKERKIELLVETTHDALQIAEAVEGITALNAALMKGGEGKKMVSPSLAFAPEDFENFRKILAKGIRVESYVAPDDRPVPIEKYL